MSEHREDFPGVARRAGRRSGGTATARSAAHVLGYVGEINEAELTAQPPSGHYELGDTIGKSGVELTYESDLRGEARHRARRGRRGRQGAAHVVDHSARSPGTTSS